MHRINTLETNVEMLSSNIETLHGNVETLSSNIDILHGNVETIESNIYYDYEEGVDGNGDPIILTGNVSTLHTFVEGIETDLGDTTDRVGVLETTTGSQGGLIQGLYNANYAPKSWVNDKNYATEGFRV